MSINTNVVNTAAVNSSGSSIISSQPETAILTIRQKTFVQAISQAILTIRQIVVHQSTAQSTDILTIRQISYFAKSESNILTIRQWVED